MFDWYLDDPAGWTAVLLAFASLAIPPVRRWIARNVRALWHFVRREATIEAAREAGRAEVQRAWDETRLRPQPEVRWKIGKAKGDRTNDWSIWNLGSDVASRVELIADPDEFSFSDVAMFNDFGRGRQSFKGETLGLGQLQLTFVVRWWSQDGRVFQDQVRVY